jgi:hypothetical protein
MGIRTAEIHNPLLSACMANCREEADIMKSILGMDLIRENYGWFAKRGLVIAIGTLRISGDPNKLPKPLVVQDPDVRLTEYRDLGGDKFSIEEIALPVDYDPVVIPNGQVIVGDSISFRSREEGLALSLWGGIITKQSDGNNSLHESSECEITKANIPLRIGLVKVELLDNVAPVAFGNPKE